MVTSWTDCFSDICFQNLSEKKRDIFFVLTQKNYTTKKPQQIPQLWTVNIPMMIQIEITGVTFTRNRKAKVLKLTHWFKQLLIKILPWQSFVIIINELLHCITLKLSTEQNTFFFVILRSYESSLHICIH